VVTPPYLNGHAISKEPDYRMNQQLIYSEIPAAPKFTTQALMPSQGSTPSQMFTNSSVTLVNTNANHPSPNRNALNSEQDATVKAELSITAAAIESVRESNAVLMEQLHLLQGQNKKLQAQLDKRDKEIAQLHSQMQVMIKKRQAVASQASAPVPSEQSSNYWSLLLLLALAAGGGFAYWYLKLRDSEVKEAPYVPSALNEPQILKVSDKLISEQNIEESSQSLSEPAVSEPIKTINIHPSKDSVDDASDNITEKTSVHSESLASTEKNTSSQSISYEPLDIKGAVPDDINKMSNQPHNDSQELSEEPVYELSSKETLKNNKINDLVPNDPSEENNVLSEVSPQPSPLASDKIKTVENKADEESPSFDLEFESGLHQLIPEVTSPKATVSDKKEYDDQTLDFVSSPLVDQNIKTDNKEDITKSPETISDQGAVPLDEITLDTQKIDFNPVPVSEKESTDKDFDPSIADFFADNNLNENKEDHNSINKLSNEQDEQKVSSAEEDMTDPLQKTSHPLKSKAALDTLLSLAKTYIGMDDTDSAISSLGEVMEFGNKTQKAEAKKLLDEIKSK
jgi:pilus assembly protein FimV